MVVHVYYYYCRRRYTTPITTGDGLFGLSMGSENGIRPETVGAVVRVRRDGGYAPSRRRDDGGGRVHNTKSAPTAAARWQNDSHNISIGPAAGILTPL